MRLTWKDGLATLLTAGIVALYVAFLAGADLPLVSGPRVLAGVALVAGLSACALGASPDGGVPSRSAKWFGGILGTTALVTAVVTLITGSEVALAILVGSTVALWLVSTVRHAFTGTGPARVSDRDLRALIERDRQLR